MPMDKHCTYRIEVLNGLDEADFNASSPLQIRVVRREPDATHTLVVSDQAGLIGLLRHLHAQGFVILSFCRER
jgi:hypothetical protein